ncbi:divalent-cation tolerance protein CutA [Leptospira biflexa]|uniref:Putative divalent ion tolerance protein CutA1 cytochrome c biogenesis n=1 Tax=Leptospira biflexa serovar Patoc (strain Patoc 1 / ATCC 23582 / Paris) TaxID=456481 RepID=B0SKS4_LEPBP|nr:divalent-cation tolerance protein CutA [Leptospira biflexa]ABZ93208.1 Divalent ion tolerance protein [Leptospira biflexa serovar Patoc strain 'Patoc 1 (Ames)']ABZ96831.1 Putative divalent ion tolerance protein CutA1; cytochrome c biogenesis [Leptospira biflexa serovar Patoc strain 'Patoc 1 (Paris)']TGM38105.1 divalent-cation tolerance protein CutA [Leptospira biflexa]TGM41436.1 divalent-cation tolerance protein CutA [Leptospira biflexa]TGM47640.1 divalent-cation tolerance protein CutA [Lept
MEIEKNYVTVYTTFPSKEEAKKTAKIVISEQLAACANLIDKMESIYVWNNRLEESNEVVCFLKTTAEKSDSLMQRIKELHSYDTPCIVVWPILTGDKDYLDWIRKSL